MLVPPKCVEPPASAEGRCSLEALESVHLAHSSEWGALFWVVGCGVSRAKQPPTELTSSCGERGGCVRYISDNSEQKSVRRGKSWELWQLMRRPGSRLAASQKQKIERRK